MTLLEINDEYGIAKSTLKRVQRRMTELGLYGITVKNYNIHLSKKAVEG